jgi:hypothetical protein
LIDIDTDRDTSKQILLVNQISINMELDSALQRQEFITSVPDFGKESSETLLTVKRIEAMMLQYREGSSSILSSTALGSGLPVGRDDQLKTESSKAQTIQSYY